MELTPPGNRNSWLDLFMGIVDRKFKYGLRRCAALGYVLYGSDAALGAENERIVEALNWTVVFLMAMPYVILAGVAGWIFHHYTRRSRRKINDRPGSRVHLIKKGASSR